MGEVSEIELFCSLVILRKKLGSDGVDRVRRTMLTLVRIFMKRSLRRGTENSLVTSGPILGGLGICFGRVGSGASRRAIGGLCLLRFVGGSRRGSLAVRESTLTGADRSQGRRVRVFGDQLSGTRRRVGRGGGLVDSGRRRLRLVEGTGRRLRSTCSHLHRTSRLRARTRVGSLISVLDRSLRRRFLGLRENLGGRMRSRGTGTRLRRVVSGVRGSVRVGRDGG